MKRRSFLKALAGAIAGAVVAPKVEAAAAAYDDLYVYPAELTSAPVRNFPRGLAYLVNNDSRVLQSLSRDSWTEEPLTLSDSDRVVKSNSVIRLEDEAA